MATVTSTFEFPSVDDRPDASVLIYDGHCKFCRANIRWISAIDEGKVAYISLHDPFVKDRWPELSHEQLMKHIYLIDGDQKYPGAAAFKQLSRKLKMLWPIMPLMHIPFSLPVWQFFYNKVARIRYRFGRIEDDCENGACSVHFD